MLKLLTPLTIGLLTVIAIAPKSEAMTANVSPLSLRQPAGDLHAQVIIKVGGQPEYSRRGDVDRRRQRELEREQEVARRRREYYYQRNHSHPTYRSQVGEYRGDRDKYQGEYRRDR
jgi:hypothetical protein